MTGTILTIIVASFLAAAPLLVVEAADQTPSTDASTANTDKLAWFKEAKFGMFITWGLYSVPAGNWKGVDEKQKYGEWIEWNLKIPHADYAAIAQTWDPKQFDAEAWATAASNAGMKYLLITAKFHDGFLMYPSKITSYNIQDCTPWKRDPVAELGDACARHGLKFGVYWNHVFDWQNLNALTPNPKDDAGRDLDKYIDEVSLPQLKELLLTHPQIGFIWFDDARKAPEVTPERAKKFADLIHSINPNIIFNSRLGGGAGDYKSMGDNQISPAMLKEPWETAGTINDTWGYKAQDTNFKPAETLLHNLIDIASKGGNYILNVGPSADGVIPAPELDRLKVMGDWLKVNGVAIYGTTASPLADVHGTFDPTKLDKNGKPSFTPIWDWRCTTKRGKLYITVFDWPTDGTLTVPLKNLGVSAYLLSQRDKALTVTSTANGLSVSVPKDAHDKIASVVVLNLNGPAEVMAGTTSNPSPTSASAPAMPPALANSK